MGDRMNSQLSQFDLNASIRPCDSVNRDEFSPSWTNLLLSQISQAKANPKSRNSQAAKVVKPRKKSSAPQEGGIPQQERPKRGRPRKCECCKKPEGAAVSTTIASEVPLNVIEQNSDKTELQAVGQRQFEQTSLNDGPLRFSQLLAQDSQCSNQEVALNPDTPMPINHRPPALGTLLGPNSPANPPEASMLSKRPRISEVAGISVGSEQNQARTDSSCHEETIRAQIMACLLDPNFRGLLTQVEKVWRDFEISVSSFAP